LVARSANKLDNEAVRVPRPGNLTVSLPRCEFTAHRGRASHLHVLPVPFAPFASKRYFLGGRRQHVDFAVDEEITGLRGHRRRGAVCPEHPWLPELLRQSACGFVGNALGCAQIHRSNHHRSGQLMRDKHRSTRRGGNRFLRRRPAIAARERSAGCRRDRAGRPRPRDRHRQGSRRPHRAARPRSRLRTARRAQAAAADRQRSRDKH
jgi:hypothetical protein